tara:strand:- start:3781 stop:5694 length:1914 start_codon:yes stop_codon:yes gene_type:complete
MPVYYNDGLDDPVQYDRQASFVGGQISNFRENLLNESQAESLKDLDAPKNGVLKSRRGFHRFADLIASTTPDEANTQAIAYFDTDAKEALIAFVNGEIFSINNIGAISTTGLTGTKINNATNRVYTAQVSDKLFFSNYTGTGKVGQISWDNGGSTWVVRPATDGPVNAKYLVSNNYRIFAYQPSDDQIYVSEFLPNVTGSISSLTITNGGATYTAGTLSATGGGGTSFAGTYTVDGSGTIDSVTITNAGSGYTSLPTIVISHAGDGNAVITPAIEAIFDGTGNLPFKVGLGDPVTGLASWVGFNLVVFCKNSCYVVDTGGVPAASGTAPKTSDYTIRTISATTGCVSHGSIAQVGEDLFFLSRTGVRSIRRTMEENMVASDVGVISYPIQDVIDEINWAAVENATSVFWNNRYLLSVPTGASTVNDTTIVYNTNTQSWMGVWRGDVTVTSGVPASTINPYQYAVTQFSGGKPYLISLDKVGNPLQYRDFVEDKNLVDTDFQDKLVTTYKDTGWEALTRAFTFNEQTTSKDAEFAEFEFDRSNAVIDIGVILDGAEQSNNLADELDTGTGELRLTFTLPSTLGSGLLTRYRYSMTQYPEFRELQFKFQQSDNAGTESKYLALRSIYAGGFLNSVGEES